jgi:type IV pilus assembly protein PilO
MPDLRNTKKKLTYTLIGLAVVDIVAVAVLFSPLVGSVRSRRDRLDQLWKELQAKTRQVEPLRGLDKKIPVAHEQIKEFYADRFTSQESVISTDIGKLASQTGVRIGQVKYDLKNTQSNSDRRNATQDPEVVGLRRVRIEADFSGDYLQLVRFINALERNHLFFTVESVELGGEQGGSVKLQIKAETYLNTGAA